MMIGLVGAARSGKSTVADYLSREYGYEKHSFATRIREGLLSALPFLDREYLHEKKDVGIPKLHGTTGRALLQQMGHEWGRNIDTDMWVKALDSYLDIMCVNKKHVVIDDVRYLNEVNYIKDNGGFIVGIDRPLSSDQSSASWRQHASEDGIPADLVDTWIGNITEYEEDLIVAAARAFSHLFDPEHAHA